MSVSEVFLSCTGKIEKGPKLFYYSKRHGGPKDQPVCKFAVPYSFKDKKDVVTQFYNFVAFKELAEFIATHYKKGSVITVVSARPWRDREVIRGKMTWYPNWIISEIAAPTPKGPQPRNPETITEVDLSGGEE